MKIDFSMASRLTMIGSFKKHIPDFFRYPWSIRSLRQLHSWSAGSRRIPIVHLLFGASRIESADCAETHSPKWTDADQFVWSFTLASHHSFVPVG